MKYGLRSLWIPLVSFSILAGVGYWAEVQLDSFLQLQLIFVLVNVILAVSLNLVNGITGQFSLGHAGFMAVGAYVSAFGLKQTVSPGFFDFFLWACIGGLAAGFAGWLVGLPSLRLRGDYLAVVTLGFGEIIRVVVLNLEVVGGARGYPDIPQPSSFFLQFIHASFWCLLTFFVCWRLVESSFGRKFLSVREDELAAEACGVDTTKAKIQSFVIASFFAGTSGACLASLLTFINPSTFGFTRSVDAVIMVVLGGMGSFSGAILAAAFVTVMPELLRPLQDVLPEWFGPSFAGLDLRMVIYSLALVLVMILRPQGLFGRKEVGDLLKRVRHAQG